MFESKAAEHTRPLFALANLLPLAFLVVTENEVILIDGCVGSGKPRNRSQFDHLDPSWFTEFTNTGFTPDDVSTVVLSHLHVHHVRWATQRGFVNLTERDWGSTAFSQAVFCWWEPGSNDRYICDVVPGGESGGHFGAVIARGELVSAGPEVRGDRAEYRQKPLSRTG